MDAGAQLASRQFDRDQFKVLQRAATAGVGPIVAYSTDDSKQDALVRCAKENAGQVYCMLGVHSDNIKRANDRLSPARMEQLRDLVLEPGCVGLMAGLAFRDVGTRYAQERALSEQMELAASVGLPLVLYEVRAAEALVERITEFRSGGGGEGRAADTPIAIFNFGGSEEELRTYLDMGCHIVLTGRVCEPGERGDQLRSLAASIPPDRLMLASDSPFGTPQNIPDVFVREGRNEPSNLPFLLDALAPHLAMTAADLAAATRRNALRFFGIREAAEAAADAAAAAAAAAAAPGAAAPVVAADGGAAGATAPAGERAAKGDAETAAAAPPPSRGRGGGGSEGQAAATAGAAATKRAGAGRKGGRAANRRAAPEDDNEEDEGAEEEVDSGSRGGAAGRAAGRRAAGAANLFSLMQLGEGNEDEDEEEGGQAPEGDDHGGDDRHPGDEGNEDEEEEEEGEADADTRVARAASGRGASSSGAGQGQPGRAGAGAGAAARPPPRNFVAEYAAAAAARGPAGGPRVSYACRGCRSVLFSEADCEAHEPEERGLFGATKPRKKGRGKGGDSGEGSLCSMHFLRAPLPWMESCLRSEGPRLGEGKLLCPTCSAKLGKWAAGGGAGGVQCSCGVVVGPPAYALLRARLDILDSQLDIASAVASTLQAYAEEEAAPSDSGSSDGGGRGGRKKRAKQRRDKTANFSSFRNKNFGFSLKQQRQIADSVAAADGGGGGAAGGGKLGPVDEEVSD